MGNMDFKFLSTSLTENLKITYPIIQAGMAGGPTTPQLVASVSEAGGLGKLGAAYLNPLEMKRAIQEIRKLTDKPFGVNLFVVEVTDDFSQQDSVIQALKPVYSELGLDRDQQYQNQSPDYFKEQLQVLIEERVPVISTAFGLLSAQQVKTFQQQGSKVMGMITTVQEAQAAEQAGYDLVVAQGTEAGGHRGTFQIKKGALGANIGTMALVPQVVDHVQIPVIAAGGIMDGRGLVAALALGAAGIQLGTRYLTAQESGAHPAYQRELLASTEESTVLTDVFSGRPARGIKNRFIDLFVEEGIQPLPFPSQNTLTQPIRKEAAKQSQSAYMSLWAGQGTRLLTANQSAAEITREIVQEAARIIHSFK